MASPAAAGWRTALAHARIRFTSRRLQLRAAWRAKWPVTPPAPAGESSRRPSIARAKPRVVFVVPASVYPMRTGASTRILNLLRHASREFEIHLALFSTTRDDASQRRALEEYCASVTFLHREEAPPSKPWTLVPRNSELLSFDAANRRLRDLVETTDAAVVQLEHGEIGMFAGLFPERKIVITEHDLNFVTLARRLALGFDRRFAIDRSLWTDKLAWERLLRYDIRCAERAAQLQVMSRADGDLLARYLKDGGRRIRVVENGVDTDRFIPPGAVPRDLEVLFVGTFVNSPNLDAVSWIADEIWPRIRAARPAARLAIVGSHPTQPIEALDGRDGIDVIGTVPDSAPYYRRAKVLLAPIRAGSGTRLKLVEAFASELPVVATSIAAEGLESVDGVHLELADSPEEIAQATIALLDRPEARARIGSEARKLAVARYDWRLVADRMMNAWDELLPRPASTTVPAAVSPDGGSSASLAPAAVPAASTSGTPAVSILIPTRNGGERLGELLGMVRAQQVDFPFEVICIDSASREADLEIMRRYPVTIESIDPKTFNHGLTRDLAASRARGRVLVFLNQDAVPVDRLWLHQLTAPLLRPGRYAAVQGGIRELPSREETFYWHSCGPRFYFTSESQNWIERHDGVGFSTVNAALRREAWERLPFGWAPILEDKKWQAGAEELGFSILDLREAAVLHSHTYDLRTLFRRCASEGYGWKLLGERYGAAQLAADLRDRTTFRRWGGGVKRGEMHTAAEWLFPWVRPLALYWGNRFARGVAL